MRGQRIGSPANPLYRQLQRLAGSARERRREGLALLDGIHLSMALRSGGGRSLRTIVAEAAVANSEVQPLLAAAARVSVLSDGLFRTISQVSPAVGLIELIEIPAPALAARIETDAVYLDRVQDPGNVGTILRTCAAAGIEQVLLGEGSAQAWSPKVLRAAMGAHFALQIHEAVRWPELEPRLAVPLLAAARDASVSLYELALAQPCMWAFGREGEGLAPEIAAAATRRLLIPQAGGVESLNVAAAAAVCLFEQRRQRLAARAGGAADGRGKPG